MHIIKRIDFPGVATDITTPLISHGSGGDLVYHDGQFFIGNGGIAWNGRWQTSIYSNLLKGSFSRLNNDLYAIGTGADTSKAMVFKWNQFSWQVIENGFMELKKNNLQANGARYKCLVCFW